jgi:dienelactone hydrolase
MTFQVVGRVGKNARANTSKMASSTGRRSASTAALTTEAADDGWKRMLAWFKKNGVA